MDRLLKFADQHAAESSTSREFDEKLFQQFIVKNLIWEYNSILKDEYLYKNKEEKEQLMYNYYTRMKKSEHYICLFYKLSFYFSKLFFPKFSSSLKGV